MRTQQPTVSSSSWNHQLRKYKVCVLLLAAVAVWHIAYFPRSLLLESTADFVDDTWASGPLKYQSSSDPTKIPGAAMMLVSKPWTQRRGERQCYFNRSMDLLAKNWLPTNDYPIILQHPDGWTETEMRAIREKWGAELQIHFSKVGSSFHVKVPSPMEDEEKPLSPLGYKKMCAFKTFGFLKAPYIQNKEIDYMMYIDDDACLTEQIKYDVFQKMQQHKVAYAYKQLFLDRNYVVSGLGDFVNNFQKKNKRKYSNPELAQWLEENGFKAGEASHWSFGTNLEWIDLKEYQRPDIMKFHKTIEESGMIFHRRWGDAPLRFLLAYLFWDSTQVMRICSEYMHSHWQPSPSTCTDDAQTPIINDAVLEQLRNCHLKAMCD